ncbi:MAG: glycosyltransferase family 1 protein [Patescibacteria group bacterium]
MSMRIGIDARFYGPRVGGGGLGRYVSELVNALQQVDRENEYILFLKKENFHECAISAPNFSKRLVDIPWYSVEEQRRMPREVRLAKVNIMHYPHWNVPVFSRVPFVVTIHDLILLEDPMSARATTRSAFVHGVKSVGLRLALEAAIHRSKHIVAISQYTKRSILEHFRVPSGKISVVYNGIRPPSGGESVDLNRFGVRAPYFLYVGNRYPHKNLEMLLESFADFCRMDSQTMLVLAGKDDVFTRELQKHAKALGISNERLLWIDTPTDALLARLYIDTSLAITPSRIEGFGIPPLEALSFGVPVAASRASSLPEVLGESVRYFDHDDASGLTRLMHEAIVAPELWSALRNKGVAQAETFTWKKTAKAMCEIYRHYADRRV